VGTTRRRADRSGLSFATRRRGRRERILVPNEVQRTDKDLIKNEQKAGTVKDKEVGRKRGTDTTSDCMERRKEGSS